MAFTEARRFANEVHPNWRHDNIKAVGFAHFRYTPPPWNADGLADGYRVVPQVHPTPRLEACATRNGGRRINRGTVSSIPPQHVLST